MKGDPMADDEYDWGKSPVEPEGGGSGAVQGQGEERVFDPEMTSALFSAVKAGETERMAMLAVTGADVNGRDADGLTPLMVAVRSGRMESLTTLIRQGSDLNARDLAEGLTPIMWAVKASQQDALKALLRGGADQGIKNLARQSALTYARETHNIPLYGILQAAERGEYGPSLFGTEEVKTQKASRGPSKAGGRPPGHARKGTRPKTTSFRSEAFGNRVAVLVALTLAAVVVVGIVGFGCLGLGPLSSLEGLLSRKKSQSEARYTLYLAVQQVEALRMQTSAPLLKLSGKPFDDKDAWRYEMLPNGKQYRLSLLKGGRTYTYYSSQGIQAAFPEFAGWGGLPATAGRFGGPAETAVPKG